MAADFQSEKDQFKDGYNGFSARKEDKQLLDYYKKLGFKPNQIMYHSSPDIVSDKIKAIGTYFDGDADSPIYKKPVQPVVYWNKDNVINKTLTSLPANPNVQKSDQVNVLPLRSIQQFVTPSVELQPTNFQTIPKKPQGPRYGTLAGDENLNLPENYTQQQREAARKKRDADEFTRKTLEYQAKQRGTKAPIAQMFQKGGENEPEYDRGVLPEATIAAEAPLWKKLNDSYETSNPYDEFFSKKKQDLL